MCTCIHVYINTYMTQKRERDGSHLNVKGRKEGRDPLTHTHEVGEGGSHILASEGQLVSAIYYYLCTYKTKAALEWVCMCSNKTLFIKNPIMACVPSSSLSLAITTLKGSCQIPKVLILWFNHKGFVCGAGPQNYGKNLSNLHLLVKGDSM